MKLLYITNGINASGGLERVLSIKASYLAENYGYEVTILSLNNNHLNPFYEFSKKIKMVSIDVGGNPIQYFLSYKNGICNIVKKYNPDVISVCDDGLKAFFLPKILRIKTPVIYERHVSKEVEMNNEFSFRKKLGVKLKWQLMEFLAKDFSKFVVLTNGNKKEWSSLQNLTVIANPLSFYPEQSSSLQNKTVISVGRHSYQKGYDLLLSSWQKVLMKCPDWKLEIYGKVDDSLGLVRLAEKLGIEKSITFYKPERDISQKYLESSLYVMSSRYEGFGMVLIEAMACGLPCVSFDCNYGPSDIIIDSIDGFLVEKENKSALAEKIVFLIDNLELRRTMGSKGKENVKRYLAKPIVDNWDRLFKSLFK
ncbi:hypothetical protein ASG01_12645 [Chryseobacterium sp. Leaf180]|uniref:glycosyltransferase family 4 protein n=1 Tax=Chryseobacterium sp. Leaf180 TaxID=1736289 RepID=UPI0006F2F9E4|nr:glycosyltransferase family 4 protein [Chryseobacterium sp. Leaf180]KQR91848.1 hypothetical protein ASG01_12645 [Chryseobacterium sp. Leaf180]